MENREIYQKENIISFLDWFAKQRTEEGHKELIINLFKDLSKIKNNPQQENFYMSLYNYHKEIKGLEGSLDILIEKQTYMLKSLAAASEGSQAFELQHRAKEVETNISKTRQKIALLSSKSTQDKTPSEINELKEKIRVLEMKVSSLEINIQNLPKTNNKMNSNSREQDENRLKELQEIQQTRQDEIDIAQGEEKVRLQTSYRRTKREIDEIIARLAK